ncbi:hypothetical protein ACGF0J_12860 [Nonomuraea sp. NPDC047897]|uniref:hypothetical protein n=1 Tax=Nonomuraea sp. NPDC047897 TaxID=3364346 RepID=UPI00371FEEDB
MRGQPFHRPLVLLFGAEGQQAPDPAQTHGVDLPKGLQRAQVFRRGGDAAQLGKRAGGEGEPTGGDPPVGEGPLGPMTVLDAVDDRCDRRRPGGVIGAAEVRPRVPDQGLVAPARRQRGLDAAAVLLGQLRCHVRGAGVDGVAGVAGRDLAQRPVGDARFRGERAAPPGVQISAQGLGEDQDVLGRGEVIIRDSSAP